MSNEIDIIMAKRLINSKEKKKYCNTFSKYCSIYPFTTENIKGYYDFDDIKNKDILTVCSSGDHIFNAMLMGAKTIDCFDINIFTKYYLELKKAGIISLNYEEFNLFFFMYSTILKNKNVFKKDLYIKLREVLNLETRTFWDEMYQNNSGLTIRKSNLFSKDENLKNKVNNNNLYLTVDNFYKLKQIVQNYNINFIEANIINLPEVLNKEYNTIYLSNIAKYIRDIFPADSLQNYKKFILQNMSKLLKDNGKMFVAYIYDAINYDDKIEWYHPIDNYKARKEVFDIEAFDTTFFSSATQKFSKDMVITYKKVR